MSKRVGLLLAMVLAICAISTGAVASGGKSGKVTVVHAVPDLTVDVYVNDALFLEDFKPGTVVGPVDLPVGNYNVEITPANSDTVAISGSAALAKGADVTLVAHLAEGGAPVLGVFANDQSRIRPWKSRVTIRHTADAPAVDVRVKRPWMRKPAVVVQDLTNGDQATAQFFVGPVSADVTLANTNTVAIGPTRLLLKPARHYYVYAWGSASAGNLGLIVQERRLPIGF